MNVNGKYIKDENGNIISPITSGRTVFMYNGNNIDDCVSQYKLLYEGGLAVPPRTSTNSANITITDNIDNYDVIIFSITGEFGVRMNAFKNISGRSVTIYTGGYSTWRDERLNLYCAQLKADSTGKKLTFDSGCLIQISQSNVSGAGIHIFDDYASVYVNKIIGINYKF